jgi:hypothetical protein
MSSLRNDQEYGQCVSCGRVFVVSVYRSGFCNYDFSTLEGIGQVYPSGVKVGA